MNPLLLCFGLIVLMLHSLAFAVRASHEIEGSKVLQSEAKPPDPSSYPGVYRPYSLTESTKHLRGPFGPGLHEAKLNRLTFHDTVYLIQPQSECRQNEFSIRVRTYRVETRVSKNDRYMDYKDREGFFCVLQASFASVFQEIDFRPNPPEQYYPEKWVDPDRNNHTKRIEISPFLASEENSAPNINVAPYEGKECLLGKKCYTVSYFGPLYAAACNCRQQGYTILMGEDGKVIKFLASSLVHYAHEIPIEKAGIDRLLRLSNDPEHLERIYQSAPSQGFVTQMSLEANVEEGGSTAGTYAIHLARVREHLGVQGWPSYPGKSPGYVDRGLVKEGDTLVDTEPPPGACKDIPWGKHWIWQEDSKAYPRVKALRFTPDGKYLIITRQDDSKIVRSLTDGKTINKPVYQLAHLSQDGRLGMAGNHDTGYQIYSLESGEIVANIKQKDSKIGMEFRGEGKFVSTYSEISYINQRLWEADTGKEVTFFQKEGPVAELALSPDHRTLVTAVKTKPTLQIWDLKTQMSLMVLEPKDGKRGKLVISPDGQYLITTHSDYKVPGALWNLRTGKEIRFPGHNGGTRFFGFSPDSQSVIVKPAGIGWASPEIWNIEKPTQLSQLKVTVLDSRFVFSADGKFLIELPSPNTGINVFDTTTWKILTTLGPSHSQYRLPLEQFCPDRKYVLIPKIGTGKLVDVATGIPLTTFKFKSPVVSSAFSSKGDYLAVMASDGTIRLQEMKLPCGSTKP